MSQSGLAREAAGSRLYSSVVHAILDTISSEGLVPGDALPPERTLAALLQVSRGSVREALRVLQHAGVLEVRLGSGAYLVDGGSRAASLRAQAEAAGEHSPLDLIVVRAAIEPMCAEYAAIAHNSSDADAIRAALVEHERATDADEDPSAADMAFHQAVAAATHNRVLLTIEETLLGLMKQQLWRDLKEASRATAGAEYLHQHQLVFQAIEQRDANRASRLMLTHISAIETGLIAELEHSEAASQRPEQPPFSG